jgi:hemerythrin
MAATSILRLYCEKSADAQDFPVKEKPACPGKKLPARACQAKPSSLGHADRLKIRLVVTDMLPKRFTEALMALLSLNQIGSVGVRAMDDQHGILMDTMVELRQAVAHGDCREQISEVLDRLIEFTRMHFVSEEQLMQTYSYPDLATHCVAHQRILALILQSSHRLQHGEKIQTRSLLTMLRESYTEHIEYMDQEYGPWLNEHGVD